LPIYLLARVTGRRYYVPVNITKEAWAALFILSTLSMQVPVAMARPLPASATADKVLVLKAKRKLLLLSGGKALKVYRVSLGGHPVGRKIREGDRKTPEGKYVLDWHNAQSDYYKSIHISYPNPDDLARATKLDVPPGGELFVHGQPNDYPGHGKKAGDWTDGCIAVSNAEMDEIWRAVADGTPIEIKR
jgi:murein L,D-transpeptidase YafK